MTRRTVFPAGQRAALETKWLSTHEDEYCADMCLQSLHSPSTLAASCGSGSPSGPQNMDSHIGPVGWPIQEKQARRRTTRKYATSEGVASGVASSLDPPLQADRARQSGRCPTATRQGPAPSVRQSSKQSFRPGRRRRPCIDRWPGPI